MLRACLDIGPSQGLSLIRGSRYAPLGTPRSIVIIGEIRYRVYKVVQKPVHPRTVG